jgi:hypothetical protein
MQSLGQLARWKAFPLPFTSSRGLIMFRRFKLVVLALALLAVAGTNLCAQRTPRERAWSYSGDPRAERTPNFRLPMEALLSARTPEDLIRAGTQPGRAPAPRAIAKPQTLPTVPPVVSLPDEEVDPFADDPVAETAQAAEPAVVATEPAAPASDGMTGGQLLGVLGDVAGSFLPDTSRVTEALPQLPGGGPPAGAAPPGMAPPIEGAAEADPFSAPAEGDDPFAEPAATTDDPYAAGPEEPAAEAPVMEADPFQ